MSTETMPITLTVTERVARGVALLDGQVPDWVLQVDPGLLDMGNTQRCVDLSLFGSSDYGFDTRTAPSREIELADFDALATEWRRVLAERLPAGSDPR